MDKQDQKEFVKALFSYKDDLDDMNKIVIDKVEFDVRSTLNKAFLGKDQEFDMKDLDQVLEFLESENFDLIDLVDDLTSIISKTPKQNVHGKEIDLSASAQIMEKAKNQFIEHKKSEDINNF